MPASDRTSQALDRDRLALLDLSLRNPLLNYRSRRGVEFIGESSADLLRLLVVEGKAMTFLPAAPTTKPHAPSSTPAEREPTPGSTPPGHESSAETQKQNELESAQPAADPPVGPALVLGEANPVDTKLQTTLEAEELAVRLLRIDQAARSSIEEQGVNTLFIALGFLSWRDPESPREARRAPLVLIPVKLERSNARERFKLRHDGEDLVRNLSLAEKLRIEYRADLPDWESDDTLDLDSYFTQVAQCVATNPEWKVERDAAVLGFFSFGKFLMYNDLDLSIWPEGQKPVEHEILGPLFRGTFEQSAYPGEPIPGDDQLIDDALARFAPSLVVDADSSQSLAVLDVATGRSLVIQGPPGTGKSQTITNLIADAIGRGRTVLFVAEKLAALEVVKRRLDLAGLGLACLELHSNKTTRKRVIDELRRTLDAPRPARSTATAGLAELLAGDRARLNEHAVAMNDPVEPMEMAPYEAVGKLLAVDARRSGGSWPRLALDRASSWNAVERQRRLDLVRELQRSCSMLGGTVSSHPLWGARKTRFLPSDQERIKSQIEALRQPVEGWIAEASKLAQSMGVSPPKSPAEAATREWQARAIASARARPSLDPGLAEWEDSALDDLLRAGAQWALLREKHDAVLLPEAWDSDVLETRQVWNTTGRKFWRFFSPSYWKARGRIARLCRSKPPRTHGERLALLDAILEGNRLRQSIKDSDSLGSQLFGTLWQGETSDWSGLRGVAKTIRTLRGLVAEGALPAASLAAADPASARALEEQANRSESAGATAKSRLSESLDQLEFAPTEREKVLALPFDELRARLGGFSDRLVDLPILGNWNQLATRLAELGLEAVATLASDWPDAVNHLDDLVEGGIAERCLAVATETRPSLQSFEGATHEQRIDLFARRDAEQFETTRARLASQHFDSLPRQVAAIGQLGVLRREMEKKARHLPVRQLMAKAGQAVRAVKPVFLMSPLSVAAYLPPGGARFDLVVFDEASQVRPVEAFGAIARGNQVVVVGDKQQMPPTTFFDRMIDEETADFDDEDEPSPESGTTSAPGGARELESILGLFDAAGAPSRMLRWHYRSRHDSLIAVSNAEFYQNRLVVFPSPRLDRGHYGLSLRLLPETHYDRGGSRTNPGEADAVCQAVMDFARDQMAKPESERETLGVAAFSIPQAQAILDRLEGLRRDRLELEPFFAPGGAEPFFVKNLENVQGDERDAVFISVGYGRTKEGTLSLNFGPLNASGGQRRLNVLISRAKKRCIVFSNIRGADLDLSRTSAEGVKALKAFLTYAEGGSLGDSAPSGVAAATDSVLERVEADLVDAGYRAEPSFGSSSERVGLAVLDPKDPAAFVMGIHTDGRRYASARSATDRNRLRDLVYDRLGWRTFYAWGLDWLHDGERAKSKLLRAIEEAVASRRNPPPPATTTPAHSPSVTDGPARLSGTNAEQTARSPKPKVAARQENATSAQQTEYQSATAAVGAITPYVLAKPRIRLGNDELAEVSPEHIASWVKEIVDVEWPVHVAEVKRRILDATATKRLGSRIDAALDAGIAHAARSGMVRKSGEFLTHTDPANSRIRDRSELPATSRKLEMIAPEELSAAVHFVLGQSMGAAIEELPPAVAKLLGLTRAHEELAAAVAASAQRLVETGRLRQQGELLVVVPPVSQPPIA